MLTYDGARLRRRREGDVRRPPEIDRRAARARATATATSIRERYPNIPRRVSGYNLDDLLPENGLPRRARARRHRGHLRDRARGDGAPDRQPAVPLAARARLRGRVRRRRPRHARARAPADSASRASTTRLVEDMKVARRSTTSDLSMLPDGRGWLLVEFGGETKEEADERARECMDALEARQTAAPTGMKLYDDPRAGGARLGGARGRPRRDRVHPGQARHVRGLGGLRRPARAARRVPAPRSTSSPKRYDYESALYGHYGKGCVHARWNFDLVTARGHRDVPPLPRRGVRPRASSSAARSPASTATASRGPSSCRRCSATS